MKLGYTIIVKKQNHSQNSELRKKAKVVPLLGKIIATFFL